MIPKGRDCFTCLVANRFGLSREIPSDVKRAVRQRDGFGCIRCGSAIYTYEHVDPPFSDAQFHDADAITLLCAGCHDMVTRGLLSKATVKQLMTVPKCRAQGFSFGPLDLGATWPQIRVGPVTMRGVRTAIRAAGSDVLSISPPEEPGTPFRICARLTNRAGDQVLEIVNNEWRSGIESWDAELVGPRITLRDAPGEITLVLRVNPPHELVLERLNMWIGGVRVRANESHLQVGANGSTTFTAYSAEITDSPIGIVINADGSGIIGEGGGTVHVGHLITAPPDRPRPHGNPIASPFTKSVAEAKLRQGSSARAEPRPGRNEPCNCGSGTKFKRCCGAPASF